MNAEFEELLCRDNVGNLKGTFGRSSQGEAIVLAGAEMDYPTASIIREAISEFAKRGLYGFTLSDDSYRSSVCSWMKNVRHLDTENAEIVPTYGTIFALCTAIRIFTKPGEGVIIQHPSYYRFDNAVHNNGRRVVSNLMYEHNGVYTIDYADLEKKMAIQENRLMVLCNPHNPTGKVFYRDDLERIAALAARYDVKIFSDEIFAETAQTHEVEAYVDVDPINGITSTSLGKAFNFTGVNHANLIIKNPMLREQYLHQRDVDHFGSIDPFFYTALRAAYTPEGHRWVLSMNKHTYRNYSLIRDVLSKRMPLLSLSPLEGTYVAWMDCRKLGLTDDELQKFLREDAGLILDPGAEYGDGGRGFARLCIATPQKQIERFLFNLESAYCEKGYPGT